MYAGYGSGAKIDHYPVGLPVADCPVKSRF